MRHLAPLAFALSVLAPVAAAHAATVTSDEAVAVRVSHADLDLSRPRSAAVMLNRLERASLNACGASPFSYYQVKDEVRRSACYRDSLDRAVADLGAPGVTAAYQARAN